MPTTESTETQTETHIDGDRNISAGGDIRDNTIVTGDGNTIIFQQGANVDEVLDKLRKGGLLPTLVTRLPEASFKQLLGLLEAVKLKDGDLWFRLYRACLSEGALAVNSTIPALLLTDLLTMHSIRKRWHPILEFVERLRLTGEVAAIDGALQAWVDATIHLLSPPVSDADIAELRKTLAAEQKQLAVSVSDLSQLMVYLEPDLHNRTQERKQLLFRVELVLWSPGSNKPFVLHIDEGKTDEGNTSNDNNAGLHTLDQLPALLDQAFASKDFVARIPNINQLLLEIVVPSNLLSFGFEHWKRNNHPKLTYGLQHQIVVRLQDRLTIPNPADQEFANNYWKQKWATFQNTLAENDCDTLPWLDKTKLEDYFLTMIDLQNQSDVACVGMGVPVANDKPELFEMLRDAGIPIAIWMRHGEDQKAITDDLKATIAPFFTGRKLHDLPKALYETRRSPAVLKEPAAVGNALTLLWDDPNRPPYKYSEQGVFV